MSRIFDLHCDTLFKFFKDYSYSISQNYGHITDSGLLQGGYIAQCFAIYQPTDITGDSGFRFFKKQRQVFKNTVNNSDVLELARTKADIEKNSENGKVSAVLPQTKPSALQAPCRQG